jgi:chromosomal replication initiator protein
VDNIWQEALEIIRREVKPTFYEQWFSPSTITKVEKRGDTVYICVTDEWAKDAIGSLYLGLIGEALSLAAGETLHPVLVDLSNESIPKADKLAKQPTQLFASEPVFNPRYTFESFVVGSSNRFAHAAAMAVAESPSRSYNPLFVYGGSGLGKTHLMHAIGQAVLKKNPQKKVVYVSSEAFTNEFIYLLRENRMETFKNRYRSTDILLIDDIQFLTNKNQIQEEFFHTFNALHDAGKQIVISSDRHPKEINPLEERLRSRFEWGLITDIQQPDWETRCAILQRKAINENITIEDEVVYFIADKFRANIRELEGALNKVLCFSELNNVRHIDMSRAVEALGGLVTADEPPKLNIALVQKVVADYFQISTEDMKSKRKDREITFPGQSAMYFSRVIVGATQPQIGRDFGGRDHTTVIHACEKIDKARLSDPQLNQSLQEIERLLLRK